MLFEEFQSLLDKVAALPGGLIVCDDFNCPSSAFVHVDKFLERIVDDYDLVQHVKVSIHRHDGVLDLIITSPENPTITVVVVEDMRFPHHFMVTATLTDTMPCPVRTSHVIRNSKVMDMDAFRSRLLASPVYTAPKTSTDEFAGRLRESVVGVLDQLAPSRKLTERCGLPSNRWISFVAIAACRTSRQSERRNHRTTAEADRLAYRTPCWRANHLIKESRHQHFTLCGV